MSDKRSGRKPKGRGTLVTNRRGGACTERTPDREGGSGWRTDLQGKPCDATGNAVPAPRSAPREGPSTPRPAGGRREAGCGGGPGLRQAVLGNLSARKCSHKASGKGARLQERPRVEGRRCRKGRVCLPRKRTEGTGTFTCGLGQAARALPAPAAPPPPAPSRPAAQPTGAVPPVCSILRKVAHRPGTVQASLPTSPCVPPCLRAFCHNKCPREVCPCGSQAYKPSLTGSPHSTRKRPAAAPSANTVVGKL